MIGKMVVSGEGLLGFGLFGGGDVFDKVDRGLFVHVGGFELDGAVIDSHYSLLYCFLTSRF